MEVELSEAEPKELERSEEVEPRKEKNEVSEPAELCLNVAVKYTAFNVDVIAQYLNINELLSKDISLSTLSSNSFLLSRIGVATIDFTKLLGEILPRIDIQLLPVTPAQLYAEDLMEDLAKMPLLSIVNKNILTCFADCVELPLRRRAQELCSDASAFGKIVDCLVERGELSKKGILRKMHDIRSKRAHGGFLSYDNLAELEKLLKELNRTETERRIRSELEKCLWSIL